MSLDENWQDELLESAWSEKVATDPKHKPQVLESPSSTVRREWSRWPQEAHLLDKSFNRYRRLSVVEIARIQGFDDDWVNIDNISVKDRISALGNAVPPLLSKAIFKTIDSLWKWENKTSIEICAGIGGLAIGASEINLRHLALIEMWDPACAILRYGKPWDSKSVVNEDVKNFNFEHYNGRVGILSGGPPCQPWSQSGKRQGILDSRDLFGYIPQIIKQCAPEIFLIENVPGLITNNQFSNYLDFVLGQLATPIPGVLEYGIAKGIFNAADFGVPQIRRRLFILGFRGKSSTFASGVFNVIQGQSQYCNPRHLHPKKRPWINLREAFDGLKDPGGWRQYLSVPSDNLDDPKKRTTKQSFLKMIPVDNNMNSQEEYEEFNLENLIETVVVPSETSNDSNAKQIDVQDTSKLKLNWPTKNLTPCNVDNKWSVKAEEDVLILHPLIHTETFEATNSNTAHAILGDQLDGLKTLKARFGGQVKLVYYDSSRIDSMETEPAGYANSIWLSIVQRWASGSLGMLTPDGVFILHVDDNSYHYGRMALEEVFGPENYVSTFVWQKKYSPQNDLSVPTAAQDYLIVFANNKSFLPLIGLPITDENLINDGDPRGPFRAGHKGAKSGSEDSKFEYTAPPYRWEIVEGRLPDGIWQLSPKSGVIWGVPTESGTFTFKVSVKDNDNKESTSTVVLSL